MNTSDPSEISALVGDSARAFLAGRHSLRRLRAQRQSGARAADVWKEMASLGWLALGLAEELGGGGLSVAEATVLTELFGRTLLPEPYIAGAVIPTPVVNALEPSITRDLAAAALISGHGLVTLAWQEAPDDLDTWPASCRIDDAGGLHGRKLFVPAATPDSILLVTATRAGEPAVVAVRADDPAVTMTHHATGDGNEVAAVTIAGTRPLEGSALLSGARATAAVRRALDEGTLALSAQLVGLASAAFDLTLEYLRTRVQFGQPIGSFQALQHNAVDLHTQLQLADASWRYALEQHTGQPGGFASLKAISAAKARCSSTALAVCKQAIQMHGAIGFTEDGDIGLFAAAALRLAGWLGTPTTHRRRFLAARANVRADNASV